jgi:hypothetical protein
MIRKDLYKIDVQDGLYLLVFHKKFNGGFGPALSVYINNYEFLKFDCFGIDKGHYHIFDNIKNDTIYFTEKKCEDQIDRTFNELSNNINVYLMKSDRIDIQNFNINFEELLDKLNIAREKMLEYENKFYSTLR